VPEPVLVGQVGDIGDDEALVVPRSATGWDDDIAVFRSGGRYFALNDTCTHQRASLAEGWVEDQEVECPLHAARFSLCTGEALCLPARVPARTHQVELRGDEVWLLVGRPVAEQARGLGEA